MLSFANTNDTFVSILTILPTRAEALTAVAG